MHRRLVGPGSIVSLAIKPLLILAVAIAALFVAPAAASAAPAGQVSTVVPDLSSSSASTIESKKVTNSEAGINAVYTCRYTSRPPFQLIGFTCTVQSGSLQVILNCTDGRQIFGPILQAFGTYNFNLSCAPTSFSTFSYREFS